MSHASLTPAQQHALAQQRALAQQHALALAQSKWMEIFNSGSYTGLRIVQYLLTNAHLTTTKFLAAPKSVTNVTKNTIQNLNLDHMASTWHLYSGRCTSFAVKAVTELGTKTDAAGQPLYDWKIYDLGHHRVARCFKTGVVIDSSSTIAGGAFILNPGKWARFPETDASWQFKKLGGSSSGKFKFEREGKVHGIVRGRRLFCPDSIPTLFRSVDGQHNPHFHGIISWRPKNHALELATTVKKYKSNHRIVIQWAKFRKNKNGEVLKKDGVPQLDAEMMGNTADLDICIEAIPDYIRHFGGPNGEHQWAADGLAEFHDELFAAACGLWGYPKITYPKE